MNVNIKKFAQLLVLPLAMLCFQTAQAQTVMVPGLMGVESSYVDAPAVGSDSANAYFTISNLHQEPIIILSATSDISENVTLNAADQEEIGSIVIQPGERIVMEPDGFHIHLGGIDTSTAAREYYEITLLVRRGLEAMEEIEGQRANRNAGIRSREDGIPNEHDFVVNVPVRN